mmetsp:Transcript_31922/g.42264  ORF Transcript_31922/g.42264 Transcript_31922/m.42264 type:complete len:117 (-) Transcript_31922:779-1129(-)
MSSRKPAALKHSKLTFADLRRKTTGAQKSINTTLSSTKATPSLEEVQNTPSLDIAASGFSLVSSTQQNGTGTQIYDQTQMDVDQNGESATVQALANRTSKLDAIKNLDAMELKKKV